MRNDIEDDPAKIVTSGSHDYSNYFEIVVLECLIFGKLIKLE